MTQPQKKQSTVTQSKLFTVFCVLAGEAYQINVLLPFVVFMIRDFGIAEENIGFFTGLLTASFAFCQFISSVLWGWYSDVYGRRSALLIGILCSSAALIVFGMSTSYAMALIARCVAGTMSGNMGVIKAWTADIYDRENRAFSFSIMAIGFGAGSIIASSLGGLLVISYDLEEANGSNSFSRPSDSVLQFWIFEEYAYLLPCLVGGLFTLNSLCWVTLFVRDEKGSAAAQSDQKRTDKLSMSEMTIISYYSTSNTGKFPLLKPGESAHPIIESIGKKSSSATSDGNLYKNRKIEINSLFDLFTKTKMVGTLIVLMFTMLWNLLAPIYAAQSLEFNTTEIGVMMALGGATLLLFTFLLQPYFLNNYPYKSLTLTASILCSILTLGMPAISLFKNSEPYNFYLLMTLSTFFHCFKFVATSLLFVTTMTYLNNSTPPSHCGRVNGIGQALASLMRSVGPLIGGGIWTWAMSLDNKFSPFPAYIFTLLFTTGTTLSTLMFIDKSMAIPWEDREAEENNIV